ncbi:MAG: hypothetical protein R8G33_06420 [Gammaproteobacteria bacterium]|nr:hypothetical protein [Gammaproteobacteria bacterium]
MTIVNGLLLILLFASCALGLIIALVLTDFITLKKPSSIKVLYSALVICLLTLIVGISVKMLSSEEGKKWLDSFSENGDCDKPNRPYWCEL